MPDPVSEPVPAAPPIVLPDAAVVVVTMDGRASREGEDVVERTRRRLNEEHRGALLRTFVRTAGDEIQAVARDVAWLPELVLADARPAAWWIGVGIGPFEAPMRRTARESRGEAFYTAREAVEQAKRTPWGFVLRGHPALARAEAALVLCAWLVRRRSPAQHEAAVLLRRLATGRAVAAQLGISPQSTSERLRAAGVEEEDAGRALVADLLREAARGPW